MAPRNPQAEVEQESDEITLPSDLGFPTAQHSPHREIEVEALDPKPAAVDDNGMVEIRMAETIEEFTYGNPHRYYKLEAGKRYRLPREIAAYLWDMGKILNTR